VIGAWALIVAVMAAPPVSADSGCPEGPDLDLDGLADACELALAARFAPELVVSARACNWDAQALRLTGGYLFAAVPTAGGVRLAYLPAYLHDCGWSGPKCLLRWRGGCDPHVADSELIVVDLAPDAGPVGWRAERVFLSAHCFGGSDGDCRWVDASELEWVPEAPRIWVAEGKNANYPSRAACDSGHWHFDTCDRNDRSYKFPVLSAIQNMGSAMVPFPEHIDDPACVDATELPLLPDLPGRECFWSDAVFRGWAGQTAQGSTGYALYLEDVAEMLPPSGAPPVNRPVCEGADVDPWISDLRARVESYHGLYRFAVEWLGAPISCEGEITMEFDGAMFGSLLFAFGEGASLSVETMPPETSIALLRAPSGLADVEAVRAALRDHAEGIGLAIDWSTPEVTSEGGEVVHTFWDPEPGLNASASLIYASDALVGIRVSMAL
jgi:hypothetical protein